MAVDRELSKLIMRKELATVSDLATTLKWEINPAVEDLSFEAKLHSYTGDLYIVEFKCDDYNEKPPFIEFIDPDTKVRGTTSAYPAAHVDSFFHSSGPCICAPFNQKAYKSVVETGPHGDWSFGDWMTSQANGYDWSAHSTLAGMLLLIHLRLARPEYYKGRMG